MIEPRLLRNALMLAQQKNFARAAKALHISQPTLSRNIQALEAKVGVQLFDRLTSGVVTNQAGEILLKHARIILDSFTAMTEELNHYQGLLEGSLLIGCGPYAASALLAPTVAAFVEEYPYIDIETVVDVWTALPSRMLREGFDLVLCEISELEASDDFDCIVLDAHPLVLYCRHDHPVLKNDAELMIKELKKYPLIAPTIPKRGSDFIEKIFSPCRSGKSTLRPSGRTTISDQAMIKSLILNGNGIGACSYGALANELAAGLYRTIPIRFQELNTQYGILTRRGLCLTPTSRALIELLISVDKEQTIDEHQFISSLQELSPTIETNN